MILSLPLKSECASSSTSSHLPNPMQVNPSNSLVWCLPLNCDPYFACDRLNTIRKSFSASWYCPLLNFNAADSPQCRRNSGSRSISESCGTRVDSPLKFEKEVSVSSVGSNLSRRMSVRAHSPSGWLPKASSFSSFGSGIHYSTKSRCSSLNTSPNSEPNRDPEYEE